MSRYFTDNTMDDLNNSNSSVNGLYFSGSELNSSSPHGGFSYKCCQNCPNNPNNNPNATGICHCVLPSMETIRF